MGILQEVEETFLIPKLARALHKEIKILMGKYRPSLRTESHLLKHELTCLFDELALYRQKHYIKSARRLLRVVVEKE